MKPTTIKTFIVYVVVIGLFLGILAFISRTNSDSDVPSADASSGVLVAPEMAFDFGTISMAAGAVKHLFTVKNTGAEAVLADRLYTSCMCTIATFIQGGDRTGPFGMAGHGFIPKINKTIAPNEEVSIEVEFDPAAHGPAGVGKIERVVFLENNAGEPLELNFTAFVKP